MTKSSVNDILFTDDFFVCLGDINMKITVLCVGKIKEKFMSDATFEYLKRLKRFADMKIVQIDDEKIPDNASDAQKDDILKKEGEKLKRYISKSDYVISLCIEGKNISSEVFAEEINRVALNGYSSIVFIIGGSLGLYEEIKKISQLRLSFSKMTFPHQLMRVILLEQIYRAFKINNNEQYHK